MTWTTDSATAAAMAAAVAGSADKITQLSAVRTSLGSGPRTETITRNGSLVYQATLTGEMVISNGEMSFGTVSAVATALSIDMSSGTVVRRITGSNSGRHVEEAVGLTASAAPWKHRKSPAGKYGLPARYTIAADAALAPAPVLPVATMTLQNDSASVQSAGFVAREFGQPFVIGQIPAGSYPSFHLPNGTACPATLFGIVSWPDGSMKWCGVLLRVPATSVAIGASVAITVRSGAAAPAAGARTLAEIAAADIRAELTGVENLTGTYTASLSDAIATGKIALHANGPAGAIWEIGGHYKSSGGVAHPHLYHTHFVAALTALGGGLLGFRYAGRVLNGFTDVADPMHRVATGVLKAGATTIRTMQGFTYRPGDAAIRENPIYGSNILLGPNQELDFSGPNGLWDYVQGAGSGSSDCVVRSIPSIDNAIKSGLTIPLDRSFPALDFEIIEYRPNGMRSPNRPVNAGVGAIDYDWPGATGERDHIGPMPHQMALYHRSPSAANEQALRVMALEAGDHRLAYLKSSTKQPVASAAIRASYEGLGTTEPNCYIGNTAGVGFSVPSAGNDKCIGNGVELAHHPEPFHVPYLMLADIRFLRASVQQNCARMLWKPNGELGMNTTQPVNSFGSFGRKDTRIAGTLYKGAGMIFEPSGSVRCAAWPTRSWAVCAGMFPDVDPNGTEMGEYLLDVVDSNCSALLAYVAAMPQEFRDAGRYVLLAETSPWMDGYMSWAVGMMADVVRTPKALAVRAHFAKKWPSIHSASHIYTGISYRAIDVDNNGIVNSPEGWLGTYQGTNAAQPSIVFTTGTNRLDFGENCRFIPANGDRLAFDADWSGATLPFAAVNLKHYFLVNCSGQTAQLSETLGGTPIAFTTNVSINGLRMSASNWKTGIVGGMSTDRSILANINGGSKYFKAAGEPGQDAIIPLMDTLYANQGAYPDAHRKYACATTR